MPFISLRQLLDDAAENHYGVPAFNVNNLEQIQAIMEAAEVTASPVVLQASAGARRYAGSPSEFDPRKALSEARKQRTELSRHASRPLAAPGKRLG
jgi:fructose/tagatose bisphosphate aldolase